MRQWVLDLEDGGLSSGKDRHALTPKAAEVLACLIDNAESVVSRDEILRKVWRNVHVSPDLVREYIFEIRKALGDNAKAPTYIETVGRRGFRIVGPVSIRPERSAPIAINGEELSRASSRPVQMPLVRFCRSYDGVSIAHAASGDGYPMLFAGSWMTHLDMDWESPAYGDYIKHLSDRFLVIRYDQRGNGLSQWSNVNIAFERMVDDMERVIETYGYEKIAILGMSQGASVAIAYSLRQPGRVSHLVLNGGYARGRRQRGNEAEIEESDALVSLIRHNWGNENPAVRQTLTTLFMPEASQEQMQWFNEFQKLCGPGENIAQFRALFDGMNVSRLLPKVAVPTLVLHSNKDSIAPLSEGKLLASQIQGASFVQLNSPNHMLFETERDFPKMIESIEKFVKA